MNSAISILKDEFLQYKPLPPKKKKSSDTDDFTSKLWEIILIIHKLFQMIEQEGTLPQYYTALDTRKDN